MIDIKKLNELREILNLRAICRTANVNYYTLKNKTLAFRENPKRGELTSKEAFELKKVIESKGLKLNEN